MLDYVAVDYPEFVKDGKIVDQGEYDEQLEFVTQARILLDQLPARPERAELLAAADRLVALVKGKAAGTEVAAAANQLRWAVITAYGVDVRRSVRPIWLTPRRSTPPTVPHATEPPAWAMVRPARASIQSPAPFTTTTAWPSGASTGSTARSPLA